MRFALILVLLFSCFDIEAAGPNKGNKGLKRGFAAFKNKKIKLQSANDEALCGTDTQTGELVCAPELPSSADTVGPLKSIHSLSNGICGIDDQEFRCWSRDRSITKASLLPLKTAKPEEIYNSNDTICRVEKRQSIDRKPRTLVTCTAPYMDISGTGTIPWDLPEAQTDPSQPTPRFRFLFKETLDVVASAYRVCALERQTNGEVTLACIQNRHTTRIPVPALSANDAKKLALNGDSICLLSDITIECFDATGRIAIANPLPQDLRGWTSFDMSWDGFCISLGDGAVHCNAFNNQTIYYDKIPADLIGPNPADKVVDVGIGYSFACALLQSGAVKCWSSLGSEAVTRLPTNLPPATSLSATSSYACVTHADGDYTCWGSVPKGGHVLKRGNGTTPPRVSLASRDSSCAWNDVDLICNLNSNFSRPKLRLPGETIESVLVDPVDGNAACATLVVQATGSRRIACWSETDNSVAKMPVGYPKISSVVATEGRACLTDDIFGMHCWGSKPQFEILPSVVRNLRRTLLSRDSVFVLDRFGLACYGNCEEAAHLMAPSQWTRPGVLHDFWLGSDHGCGISANQVHCWGSNNNMQLEGPQVVVNPNAIVGGINFSCVSDDLDVQCWGAVPDVFSE